VNLKKKNGSLRKEEGSAGGGWEVVYSGFVLILLCFFIMLSSFSSVKAAKILRFVKSFVESVSILPGGLSTDGGAAVLPTSVDMVDSTSPLAQIYGNLKALAESHHYQNDVALSYSAKGLVMRLSDQALFDMGQAAISPQAVPLLQKIGAIIAETTHEVRIEGHTDDVPIKTARYPSNWELSTARAVNVLRYFIQSFRISDERLSAEGLSRYQPIVPNDSPVNRAKNRRVEIVFLNPDMAGRPVEAGP
jgi:chemotaxis protein MotB